MVYPSTAKEMNVSSNLDENGMILTGREMLILRRVSWSIADAISRCDGEADHFLGGLH